MQLNFEKKKKILNDKSVININLSSAKTDSANKLKEKL